MRGFSYIQVLVVVAMLSILAAVSSPYYIQFQYKQRLHSSAEALLSDIRLVQGKAMQQMEDDQWGVHISDSDKAYVLFYGGTYNSTEANNMSISYVNSVSISPDQDIVFDPVTGAPTSGSDVTVTVSSSSLSETRTITINSEGMTYID